MNDFARRLRLARERRDYSQRDLAEKAEIDQTALSHYETGNRKPGVDNIRQLCIALDMSADYLLALTNDPKRILP